MKKTLHTLALIAVMIIITSLVVSAMQVETARQISEIGETLATNAAYHIADSYTGEFYEGLNFECRIYAIAVDRIVDEKFVVFEVYNKAEKTITMVDYPLY